MKVTVQSDQVNKGNMKYYNHPRFTDISFRFRGEVFKPVNMEKYRNTHLVSNYGRVIRKSVEGATHARTANPRLIKLQVDPRTKYVRVALCIIGETKVKMTYAHRLVALTFLRIKKGKKEVNHINADKQNNHTSNLEWCTRQENLKHRNDNGLNNPPKGEEAAKAKVNNAQVRDIRKLWSTGDYRQNELARMYNISQVSISKIVRRVTFKNVV